MVLLKSIPKNKSRYSYKMNKSSRNPYPQVKPSRKKRHAKDTLEQRIRTLENENKELWEAIEKIETSIGISRGTVKED